MKIVDWNFSIWNFPQLWTLSIKLFSFLVLAVAILSYRRDNLMAADTVQAIEVINEFLALFSAWLFTLLHPAAKIFLYPDSAEPAWFNPNVLSASFKRQLSQLHRRRSSKPARRSPDAVFQIEMKLWPSIKRISLMSSPIIPCGSLVEYTVLFLLLAFISTVGIYLDDVRSKFNYPHLKEILLRYACIATSKIFITLKSSNCLLYTPYLLSSQPQIGISFMPVCINILQNMLADIYWAAFYSSCNNFICIAVSLTFFELFRVWWLPHYLLFFIPMRKIKRGAWEFVYNLLWVCYCMM